MVIKTQAYCSRAGIVMVAIKEAVSVYSACLCLKVRGLVSIACIIRCLLDTGVDVGSVLVNKQILKSCLAFS